MPQGMYRRKNTAGIPKYLANNAPQGNTGSVKTTSKELEFRWWSRDNELLTYYDEFNVSISR